MLNNLLDVFRPKRWYRNLFMIIGVVIAVKILNLTASEVFGSHRLSIIFLAFLSLCIIASANYGINEILDAKSDAYHPQKKFRAIPSGRISKKLVLVISILFYIIGFVLICFSGNWALVLSLSLLIVSGIVYNIPPIRLKDRAYLDFTAEAINNPIRLMIGWYAVAAPHNIVPASFILGYFFLGVFLMAAKRFGELRLMGDNTTASLYRTSFKNYTQENLLMAMITSAVAFSYMLGVLSIKYSVDEVLALPFLTIWILWFFKIAYEENTIVKDPERIFEKKPFLLFTVVTAVIFIYLFYSGNQFFGWLR